MAHALVLSGRVTKGRLLVRGWKGLAWWRDGEVTITIERKHATRSALQNNYYWGVVLKLLADDLGYTVDDIHELCKLEFNAKRLILCDRHGVMVGERTIPQSTRRLNKVVFGEYLEQVRQWAAVERGLILPDPDPEWQQVGPTRSEVA